MKRFPLPLLLSALTVAVPATSVAADGKALYASTCVACHGANGKGAFPGIADLGPRMAKTDAQLISSILKGYQSKGSPMAMPAKGGNPSLTEADAAALVGYLRTLMPGSAPATPKAQAGKPEAAAAVAISEPTPIQPTATVGAAPATAAVEPMAKTETPIPVQASAEPTSTPPTDMAAFAQGAKAWGEHCASCHAMRDPKDFNDDQWKVITTHMRLRAGLDGADIRDINVFLAGSN